jgi:hypothetical protein
MGSPARSLLALLAVLALGRHLAPSPAVAFDPHDADGTSKIVVPALGAGRIPIGETQRIYEVSQRGTTKSVQVFFGATDGALARLTQNRNTRECGSSTSPRTVSCLGVNELTLQCQDINNGGDHTCWYAIVGIDTVSRE